MPDLRAPNLRSYAWVLGLLLIVASWHIWHISVGTFRIVPHTTAIYDGLAQAFLKGQTYLLLKPAPEMLALSDPYDPVANKEYRLHDAILFDGKYYVQWGPVPAILMLPLTWSGVYIRDPFITCAFTIAFAAIWTAFAVWLHRFYFPNLSRGVLGLTIILGAVGHPLLYMLGRAAVYEASIVGGQTFLMLGLFLGWLSLRDGNLRLRLALASGASLALAVGCRFSLLPAAGVTSFGLTLIAIINSRKERHWRVALMFILLLALPQMLGQGLLAFYNFSRFGSVGEVGLKYILVGGIKPLWKYPPGTIFSPAYILPNLWNHCFRPPHFLPFFPFLKMKGGLESALWFGLMKWPPFMDRMPSTTGAFFSTPFLLLLPVMFFRGLGDRYRRRRQAQESRRQSPTQSLNGPDPVFLSAGPLIASPLVSPTVPRVLGNLTILLAAVSLAAALPALCLLGATPRYHADFVPPILLLCVIGWWTSMTRADRTPSQIRLRRMGGASLVVLSIISAFLLSFSAESVLIRRFNPNLHRWLLTTSYLHNVPLLCGIFTPYYAGEDHSKQIVYFTPAGGDIEWLCPRDGTLMISGNVAASSAAPTRRRWQLQISSQDATYDFLITAGLIELPLPAKKGLNTYRFSIVDGGPEVPPSGFLVTMQLEEPSMLGD